MQKSRAATYLTVKLGQPPKLVSEAVDCFLADCKARNLSRHTLGVNRTVLAKFLDFVGDPSLESITSQHIRAFLIDKAAHTSSATAARNYTVLRTFFKFLTQENFLNANPMANIEKPKFSAPVIRPLPAEEIERLLRACDAKTFTGLRDRLALLILVDAGLRASELCDLTLQDIDIENQLFLVRHGKGDRSRRVPFGAAVLNLLRQYLVRRSEVDTPNLLVTVYGEPIDRYRLRKIVENAAKRAGIEEPVGPHRLRHTCGVQLLKNGADAFTVQKILGHTTLHMTRRYCELADSDVQEKHRLYSPGDRFANLASNSERRKRLV